jgi:hypothetical protein
MLYDGWRPVGARGNEHQRGGVTTRPGFVICAMPCAVACRPFRAGALGSALKGRYELARGVAPGS